MKRRVLYLLGGVLIVAGVVFSAIPTFVPRPSGEPIIGGTLWYVGGPLALAGIIVVAFAQRRRTP